MFKKRGMLLSGLVATILFIGGCNNETSTNEEEGAIQVVTTISQIGEPLSVIGGDRVKVESLMGPSVDPHLYNATQGDISTIEGADLIFYNGLDLEANMVEIFESISKNKPVLAIGETLSEDKLLEEEPGVVDPHIWFDIDLWKLALEAAVEELKKYSPEDSDYFNDNMESYFAELDALNEEAQEQISQIPEKHRVLVTAHDAFGYFGNKFSMEVIGLQGLSTEDEIGVSDINDTIAIIKEFEIPAIFVESSIDSRTINSVIEGAKSDGIDVELGGELFSDAMGNPGTEKGTYIGMYRHNVETIYNALK
ncbi:metal ABC transporter solute-binding protein, Zn/Mn family [Evansella sp. AB-rgal1]|uniref:metal ABC transporter solute-binding protein, Zn/Mn family n=1 Tax=Evansella sp. AB-rgal1 TaxID=3242696 RepID=UPI00359D78C8